MALTQARILAGSVVSTLVVLGVVVAVVQGPDSDPLGTPPLWLPVAQLAGGVGLAVLLGTFGYRARPVPAGTPTGEAGRQGVAAFQRLLFLRMALAESVALMSLAAAFVLGPPDGILAYAGGAAVSIVLALLHVWPGSRAVDRTRAALERDGALVPLHDALGLGRTDVIQEL